MAMAGLSVALARGIDVPGDLSITGYDDTEIAAHLQPPLTTVSTDVLGLGRGRGHPAAGADRPGDPPTDVDLPPARLVVRGSTGPAPHEH